MILGAYVEQLVTVISVDQLANGLILGSKIALAAIPYILVYKYLRMLNFAFGEIMTFGAYAIYILFQNVGWPLWISILVTMLLAALLGVIIEFVAYRPVINAEDRHLPLVTSVGVSIILMNVYQALFGSRRMYANGLEMNSKWLIGTLFVELLVIYVVLHRTTLGDQIAAVAANRDRASLVGIHTGYVYSVVFAIASVGAVLAGVFELADNGVSPSMGFQLGLLAFAAAVLARLHSIILTVIAAWLIGISIQVAQASNILNDQVIWILFVLLALIVAALSRVVNRILRIRAGKDVGA